MKADQERCQCLLERVQSVKMAGNQNKGETTYFPSNPSLFQVTNTIQEQEHKKNRNTTLKSSFIPLQSNTVFVEQYERANMIFSERKICMCH